MTKLVKEQEKQSYHTKYFESFRHIKATLVGVFVSSRARKGSRLKMRR